MDTIISGAAFGAALIASGMYNPYLIASQFSFEKWNMVQTFLTAVGCSAISLDILQRLGLKVPPPRSYTSIGLLGFELDGNLIGGAMLGAGMSLSASCPGMVFPQLAMGVPSAPMTLAGATVGGIFWSTILRPWIAARKQRQSETARETKKTPPPPKTLAELVGADRTATLLAYEVVLGAVVAAVAVTAPSAPSALHPVVGGLAVGAAQLTSLLLRGSLLGVSTCYEHLGDWVVYLFRGSKEGASRPATSALLFSAAMIAGARLSAWVRPEWTLTTLMVVPAGRAFVGGFLLAVGSRLGSGCTSGHGISGMGLMSVSSFVSMFATFAAAMAVSQLTT